LSAPSGVIYRPRTERQSHYFQAVLAEQFDAFVWIEKTHAVSPLPEPEFMEHEEDTFPLVYDMQVTASIPG